MPTKTIPWEAAAYLDSEERRAGYLEAAKEAVADGSDPVFIAGVMADIERSRILHPEVEDSQLSAPASRTSA